MSRRAVGRTGWRGLHAKAMAVWMAVMAGAWSATGAAPEHRGFLWKAQSDTATVYLLGSVHVGAEDFYPMRAAIEEAFQSSDKLAVEADVRPQRQGRAMQAVLQKAMLPAGQSLREILPADTRALLDAYLEQAHPAMRAGIDRMTPWVAGMTLALLEFQKAGLNPEWGVDLHFLRRAQQREMPILELEGIEAQLEMLSGLDRDLQMLMLKHSLLEIQDAPNLIRHMMEHWKKGDAEALAKLVRNSFDEHEDLQPLQEVMFTQRDILMTEKIETYLKGAETVFVVVGAGHLIGADSILERLKKNENIRIARL